MINIAPPPGGNKASSSHHAHENPATMNRQTLTRKRGLGFRPTALRSAGMRLAGPVRFVIVMAVAVLFCGGPSAFAVDEVVLRSSGESVKGTIKSVSKTEIVFDRAGQTVKVPVTDIAQIRWDGEPAELNITRTRESNGDYKEALKSYEILMSQVNANKANLRTDIEFLIARTQARQALTDPAKAKVAIASLENFVVSHPNSIRYFAALQWLGRVNLAAKQFEAAMAAYQKLAAAPVAELKMAARNEIGRAKLRQGKLDEAMKEFNGVLSSGGEGPAARRERFSALLGKALVLQANDKHEEALKVLDEVIAKSDPDDATVQADAFVRKGASLETLGQQQAALLAFLHVDILFPGQPEAHAEALYHLTKLWDAVGKAERSAAARRKLTDDYSQSQWAKKL